MTVSDDERMRRWRLILGGDADGTGCALTGGDRRIDAALAALYLPAPGPAATPSGGPRPARGAGLGASAPTVARWLGDIRACFPPGVVGILQQDAVERLDLARLLLEPEILRAAEPDVHLVGTLLGLGGAVPEAAKDAARAVVRHVVDDLTRRVAQPTRSVVQGALDHRARTARPRHRDIDWNATVRANLRHYQPAHRTVVPERLVGRGRRRDGIAKDVVLCVDQSGSMAASVVYASVFGAVLASMPALRTSFVAFDTGVADLTDHLHDPVDLLLGVQLGGGTDIDRALAYCRTLVTRPADTVVVLVSDLYEGGMRDGMLRRLAELKAAGAGVIALLALSDEGAPAFDHANAAALASLGVPAFACTPDAFPDVMSAALTGGPLPAAAAGSGQL